MLLRSYRITDKVGLFFLKSGQMLAQAATGTTSIGAKGASNIFVLIFTAILAVLTFIAKIFLAILKVIWYVLSSIAYFIKTSAIGIYVIIAGLFNTTSRGVSAASKASSDSAKGATRFAEHKVAESQARKTIREEIRDVGIAEDPLRKQNRFLSGLVAFMGLLIIGILIWATGDSNKSGTFPLATAVSDQAGLLILGATEVSPTVEVVQVVNSVATPIPTTTPIPEALRARGTIAYVVHENGQDDIWAVGVGGHEPLRLISSEFDDRSPAWSPEGDKLAFASKRDGNWELYVHNIETDTSERLTYDLSYQDAPAWSPDGIWLVYESYQGKNLDIYALPIDGSDSPKRITDHPAPDFSPSWSPDGRKIAFTSLRDGNKEIYVFDLDSFETTNVSNTPNRDEEDPRWSPDGKSLTYSAKEFGNNTIFVQTLDGTNSTVRALSLGHSPSWSPDGSSLIFNTDSPNGDLSYIYAYPVNQGGYSTEVITVPYLSDNPVWGIDTLPPQFVNRGGADLLARDPLYVEQVTRDDSDPIYGMGPLQNVIAPNPVLSETVNDSFNALRSRLVLEAGWDFLSELDDAFWDLDRRPQPGEDRRNWHMTGRAFAIKRSSILGFPPAIELVKEEEAGQTYWRVYLRVDEESQAGQLGEPLKVLPWDLLSASQGDVEAYNQGGRVRAEAPQGYYVDLTALAEDYGWFAAAAGTDWRANANSRNFWLFLKTEGLTWYAAMREIYRESQLGGFVPTATPLPDTVETEDNS